MTTNQDQKLSMYQTVRDFLIPNEGITKDLPNFAESFSVLLSTIKEIRNVSEIQKDINTGVTKGKKELREKLIKIAADNSRRITALAKFSNNSGLLDKIRFSISDLVKMQDNALKDYAQIIYAKAEANMEALAGYGVTQETQKSLLETINAYETSLTKPRVGILGKAQATSKLASLFDTAEAALENMDISIGLIRLTQVDFFTSYRNARKLIDTSSGSLSLKAIVKELGNGKPVKGAILIFTPEMLDRNLTAGNGVIVKKSADKGRLNIKNMPAGTYQVTIKKPGYKEKIASVSVADGERSNLAVELEKV
jgi:hypothetical protein